LGVNRKTGLLWRCPSGAAPAWIMAAREVDSLMLPAHIPATDSADVQFYFDDEKFDRRN